MTGVVHGAATSSHARDDLVLRLASEYGHLDVVTLLRAKSGPEA